MQRGSRRGMAPDVDSASSSEGGYASRARVAAAELVPDGVAVLLARSGHQSKPSDHE